MKGRKEYHEKVTSTSIKTPAWKHEVVNEASKLSHNAINHSFIYNYGFNQYFGILENQIKLPASLLEKLIENRRQEIVEIQDSIDQLERIYKQKLSQKESPPSTLEKAYAEYLIETKPGEVFVVVNNPAGD